MKTNVTETLAARVDRYSQALNEIPTLETGERSEEDHQEHEELVARLAEDPEQVVFEEGINLAAVAGVVVAWLKLPEREATRERLLRMVDVALTDDED